MKKIYFALASIISILLSILFLLNNWYNFSWVSANPDYICVKNVTDQPCEATSCEPWWTDWKRTCTGKKTTQVAYYLIRTSCEPWYSQIRNCTNQCYPNPEYYCVNNEWGWGKTCYWWEPQICNQVCWNVWWASWRNSADYVYNSTSCSVVQVDNVSPEWDAKWE